jgi:hypothetical protein
MLPKTDPGALGSLDFLRALPLDHSTFVTVLHLSELHLNLTGEFMKAYCVILCSHSFINPTSYPRTKRFYVGALTANRAIRTASELNPEFRVLGIEHSDLLTPYALS